jgi:hypothetical protein
MTEHLFFLSSVLRPQDDGFSEETQFRVQVHRLLVLLGAGLIVGFAPLYAVSNPNATDPLWARLGVAGLLVALRSVS